MANNSQDGADLTRVACHTHEEMLLAARGEEDFPQSLGTTSILSRAGLRGDSIPQLILVGEVLLDMPFGEELVNITLAAAVVTSVDANTLAEKLLHDGLKLCRVTGEVQPGKGIVGSLERASERRDIIIIRSMNLLLFNELLPKVVGGECLIDAIRS